MVKQKQSLLERRTELLAELQELDDLVVGSFFERKVNGIKRFCLSRMVGGTQRQIYISIEHGEKISRGVRQYKRAAEILRELGEINLALIKKGDL